MSDDLPLETDDDDSGGGEGWLATFCDISLLLLTFFILLLSMSSIDTRKFKESFSSIRDTFGGDAQKNIDFKLPEAAEKTAFDMALLHQELLEKQQQTFNDVRTFMTQNAIDGKMKATLDEGIITLLVPSEVLFDAASEALKPEGITFMRTLRDLFLKNRDQDINIKGYTDNSAVPASARFHDNWELSALRAVNVLRTLLNGGIEAVRLTATGLGDLDPIAPNTTEQDRAKNRRVEFILQRRVTTP